MRATTHLLTLLLAASLAVSACSSADRPDTASSPTASTTGNAPAASTATTESSAAPRDEADPTGYRIAECIEVVGETITTELWEEPDAIECGFVTVPVDWNNPSGDSIEIAVFRVTSTAATPAPDPVVYLEGGPGGAGSTTISEFASGSSSYLRGRGEVIVIDQRGTGYSVPALYCPETYTAEAVGPGAVAAAHQSCHDRFVAAGVDFGDYNSANNARDVDAVRQALGFDEWNLYGVSYGTRLALTNMRDTPDGIRSVVLDSVFPPQINGMSESPSTLYWAIDQIAENCTNDADCDVDVRALVEQGVARLAAAPVAGLDAAGFVQQISDSIANPGVIELIVTVAEASDADIAALVASIQVGSEEPELPPIDELPPEFLPVFAESVGMGYGVVCAEEAPFLDRTAGPLLGDDFGPATRTVVNGLPKPYDPDLCPIWNVPAAADIETEAVTSDIPTLIVAGTADIATPPAWSELAGQTLSRSTYAEFAGLTHGLLGNNDCLNEITLAFLDDPDTTPDLTCIAALPGVAYDAG